MKAYLGSLPLLSEEHCYVCVYRWHLVLHDLLSGAISYILHRRVYVFTPRDKPAGAQVQTRGRSKIKCLLGWMSWKRSTAAAVTRSICHMQCLDLTL